MHVDLVSTFSSGCTRGEKERGGVTNDNYHDPFMHGDSDYNSGHLD